MRLRALFEVTGRLRVTPTQLRRAASNKMQIHAIMPAEDFLRLTTKNQAGIDYIKGEAKSLLQYNRWSKQDEIMVMPYLTVYLLPDGTGKIRGHEGRHRAAAVLAKGGTELPLMIEIVSQHVMPKGHLDPRGLTDRAYSYTADDLPPMIEAEFTTMRYPTSRIKIVDPDMLKKFRRWEQEPALPERR